MAMGMRCHSTISTAMGQPIVDLDGTGSVFEVHPTYGFRSLLGVEHDAERVRCDPKRLLRPKAPRGAVGHAQRVEILRLLFERFGVTWTTALSEKLLSRLDWTDAAMCAALAVLRVQGATQGVGDGTEGTIVIADPSQLGDLVPRIWEVVANFPASSRLAYRALRVRRNTSSDENDCAVLRLGAAGLSVLSEEDTLSALRGQQSERQIIFPVGVRAIGRQWMERAARKGFWLLIAYGRLKLALRVAEIVGVGRRELTPKEMVLGANRDPWPSIEQSDYWLRCDELLDDLDLPATTVSTRRGDTWVPGMPRNQTAWLTARINDERLRERLRVIDASS